MLTDEGDILAAVDLVFDSCLDRDGLSAVEYELDGTITVRFLGTPPKDVPGEVRIELVSGERATIPVRVIGGPGIAIAIGDVEQQPPRQANYDRVGEMGGDQCRASGDMNRYGTISVYAGSAQWVQQGSCNVDFRTSPVLLSNNHVIARSDRAPVGEGVWTPGLGIVAKLEHFLPINCGADIAFAKVIHGSVQSCRVREIGGVSTTVKPTVVGEDIYKCGARTGKTSGIVEARGNIIVDGRRYNNVCRTSRGFGCPGDSGSLVVSADRQMLGIYSWGETIPCEDDPKGWFFALPTETPRARDLARYLVVVE